MHLHLLLDVSTHKVFHESSQVLFRLYLKLLKFPLKKQLQQQWNIFVIIQEKTIKKIIINLIARSLLATPFCLH